MSNEYGLGNFSRNTTTKQKMILIFGVIIVLLVAVLIVLWVDNTLKQGETQEGSSASSSREEVIDEDGNEVIVERRVDENGNETVSNIYPQGDGEYLLTEEQTDQYGNEVRVEKKVKSDNADAIETGIEVSTEYNKDYVYTLEEYLPRTKYDYLEDGSGVKMHFDISENTAGTNSIVITVDGCEEEKNRNDAEAYLNSLPVDLSGYEKVYRIRKCK